MRLAMLALLALLLTIAGWEVTRSPQSYAAQDRDAIASPANHAHPAGTDELGRDRAVRVAVALFLGLGGACIASALASAVAVFLAAFASLGPGWASRLLLFLGDLGLTLPWLFLLLLVRSALPLNMPPAQSGALTFLLLGALGVPAFLRINLGGTASFARADWMLQASASGYTRRQRLLSLLPHLRPLLLTQFLLYIPACVAAEANLGALGLGISEPLPSMGNFIANLQSAALLGSSRLVYLPIAFLVLVLLALELSIFREATP